MNIKPAKNPGGVVVEPRPEEAQLPMPGSDALPVFNLRKILVPIDFSECSRKALCYAIPLAKQFDATLILLKVVEPYFPPADTMGLDAAVLTEQTRQAAGKEIAIWVESEIPESLEADSVVRLGNPYEEIVEVAASMHVDLIVLSTHGRTGLKHAFLGSVAEKVVQHAPCPVLVVRKRERDFFAETDQQP